MNESLTYRSEDEYKTVTFMLSLTSYQAWGETASTLVGEIQKRASSLYEPRIPAP